MVSVLSVHFRVIPIQPNMMPKYGNLIIFVEVMVICMYNIYGIIPVASSCMITSTNVYRICVKIHSLFFFYYYFLSVWTSITYMLNTDLNLTYRDFVTFFVLFAPSPQKKKKKTSFTLQCHCW